jgi:hypothetical protein
MVHKDYSCHYQGLPQALVKEKPREVGEGKTQRGWYEAEPGVQVARCGDMYVCIYML